MYPVVFVLLGVCVLINAANITTVEPHDILINGTVTENVILQNVTESEEKLSPKIVGGQEVTDRSKFAYQVSIRLYGNNHFCGGTLIDNETILTAAHCCVDQSSKQKYPASAFTVVLGDLKLSPVQPTTVRKSISKVIVHSKYKIDTFENDIAILKIKEPFKKWDATIKPISISQTSPPVNTPCVVSGWGSRVQGGSVSNTLQSVQVPIISTTTCKKQYKDSIKNGMLCAGYMTGGKDACQGDSGGPLICNNTLAGVVSWGYGCAIANYPGVYTDVNKYGTWIETNASTKFTVIQFFALTVLSGLIKVIV